MIRDEPSGNRLEGTYRGIVLKHLPHGRCKIFIPGVYAPEFAHDPDLLPSAQPKTPLFAGTNKGNGVFSYPNLSSIVWCTFMNGDANLPVFDSATLGGENAMGQYELIKKASEPVSDRHMITSGKTHMLWYEKGKLSGIVEDPIRTYCSVDYDQFELENNNTSVENRYSYQISNDIVNRISKNLLSNINCQYVLDNGAGRHGELSTSTHWYDIVDQSLTVEQLTRKGTISTDNWNVMNNDGVIALGTLSTYSVFESNKLEQSTQSTNSQVSNDIKIKVPGKFHQQVAINKKQAYQNAQQGVVDRSHLISYTQTDQNIDATVLFDSVKQLTSNYANTQAGKTVNLTSDLENQFLMEDPGNLDLKSKYKVSALSADQNSSKTFSKQLTATACVCTGTDSNTTIQTLSTIDYLDLVSGQGTISHVELTDSYEMNSEGEIQVLAKKNETTTKSAGANEIIKKRGESTTGLDVTGKHVSKASLYSFHSVNNNVIEIDNKSVIGMENKSDAKMEFSTSGKKKVSGSPIVDTQYSNIINTTTSTANIQIVDNIVRKECVNNMDAKLGLTEIRITNKGSGAHCTILMDANGNMTVKTTSSVNISTPVATVTSEMLTVDTKTMGVKCSGDCSFNADKVSFSNKVNIGAGATGTINGNSIASVVNGIVTKIS